MGRQCLGVALAAVVVSSGCGEATGVSEGALTVIPGKEALALLNGSAPALHYFIVERETATLIDWQPCTGDACPSVPPRRSVTVPKEQIIGYTEEAREAIVYWWPSVPLERLRTEVGLIRSIVVRL